MVETLLYIASGVLLLLSVVLAYKTLILRRRTIGLILRIEASRMMKEKSTIESTHRKWTSLPDDVVVSVILEELQRRERELLNDSNSTEKQRNSYRELSSRSNFAFDGSDNRIAA